MEDNKNLHNIKYRIYGEGKLIIYRADKNNFKFVDTDVCGGSLSCMPSRLSKSKLLVASLSPFTRLTLIVIMNNHHR